MKKIYISGPISETDFTKTERRFKNYENFLKGNYLVVNPFELGKQLKKRLGREPSYKEYMKQDLVALTNCDCICFMNDWGKSSGATLERQVALTLGMEIIKVVGVE